MIVSKRSEAGFTLIELIVALFIFGMLAAAGVGLMRFSVDAQSATKARLDDVAIERRMSVVLTNDLAQVVQRTNRDVAGRALPAFRGRSGSELMAYVRGGRSNGNGAARSGLQKIMWQLDKGQLQRVTYSMIDGAAPASPVVMADNVIRIDLRFKSAGQWRSIWSPTTPTALPTALEFTITRRDREPVTRMFIVGTGI